MDEFAELIRREFEEIASEEEKELLFIAVSFH